MRHVPLMLPVPPACRCTGAAPSWCAMLGRWGDGQDGGRREEGFGRMGWEGDKAMYQSGFHQLPVGGVLAGLLGQGTHNAVLGQGCRTPRDTHDCSPWLGAPRI